MILGRGGRYLLHDYPHRFSIFVSADLPDRIKRVSALYDISEEEAVKKIHANDKGRAAYNRAFTKSDSLDVRLYDMVINTSSVGEEIATKIVLEAARARLRL